MSLTKKKKTILAWTIPAALIVVGAAVATPIVIINEQKNSEIINKSKDIKPTSFIENNNTLPEYLNPKNFDISYFVSYFCNNSNAISNAFLFPELENSGNGIWINKDGVSYSIDSVRIDEIRKDDGSFEYVIEDGKYSFELIIKKTYKTFERKYQTTIQIATNAFATPEVSKTNFIKYKTQEINDLFVNDLTYYKNKESISDIDGITSSADLDLIRKNINNDMALFLPVTKDGEKTYISQSNEFKHVNEKIILSTPTDNNKLLVFSSEDAYKINSDGNFDSSSVLFTFLKNAHTNGNLLYLPQLTSEESNGLSEEQIIDKQIQKLIFDSSKMGYELLKINGKEIKVPFSSRQAIVTKINLGDKFTYIVTWANLFKQSNSVVDEASEIEMIIKGKSDGQLLTWEEIQNKNNYKYIVPKKPSEVKGDLVYEAVNVEFASNDTYKTKAIVNVKVWSRELGPDSFTKEYQIEITSNFKSKAYLELESQINNVLGNSATLTPLVPTVSIVSGKTPQDVYDQIYNYDELIKLLQITPPAGITNVKYTIERAILNDKKLIIELKMSSINDENNYWKLNGIVETIRVSLDNISPTLESKVSSDS